MPHLEKKPFCIWAFRDKKRGHEKQIDALLSEIRKGKKGEDFFIQCGQSSFLSIFFSYFKSQPTKEIQKIKKNGIFSSPDLIIGAGHRTHLQVLVARKLFPKAQTLLIMKPSLPSNLFDIIIAPKHDKFLLRPQHFIQTNGALCAYSEKNLSQKNEGLILLGGENKYYDFNIENIRQQIDFIFKKFPNHFWTITNSRRTPNMHLEKQERKNVRIIDWQNTKKDWLFEKMCQSEIIFVTPDSISMIYEALSTHSQVYAFDIETISKQKSKISLQVEDLLEGKSLGKILFRGENISLQNPKGESSMKEVQIVAKKVLKLF